MDSDQGATARRIERRRRLLRYAAIVATLVLGVVLVLVRGGFRALDVAAYPLPAQRPTTWEEILARPRPVTVEVLLTGTSDGDRRVVLDESDPNIKELGDHHAPSAVVAYWVHHRIEGDYLIDAGLARAFAREGGNYTGLLRLIVALIGAESHSTDRADVAAQLRSRGISPRAVVLTHLHGDHTSGLVDLPALVPAVFGRGEDTFMQKAMIGDHLDGRPLFALDFDEAHALPPFERVLDLLGDGSICAISTPGHSPNHVSYLVNAQSGPVLITGDACAYHAQFEHRLRPTPGVHDQEVAIRSLAGLRELYDRASRVRTTWVAASDATCSLTW
jgi:glyoxylase-like metal-dependent hydrolase (beta-lactamase superfamily II)